MPELSCHASMMTTSKGTSPRQDLTKGFWRENPVLIHLLGLCPTLALTNSVANSIVMGVATVFVLVTSILFVALIVDNGIVLGRQEAFAGKTPVGLTVLDAVGMGVGFMIALLIMGSVR